MSSDNSIALLAQPSNSLNYSSTSPFGAINDIWILPIFVLCLVGLLCTIVLSFVFVYLSARRLNDHFLVTNLFICFSLGLLYLILIIFLLRSNEIFCGLREFLSQLSYAFLYSALLCRYIMQWLGSRILSKRTKRYTSLLIYLLLIFVQIPIGVLWWYFTIPRLCPPQQRMNVFLSSATIPRFFFHFRKPSASISCSDRCLVDYRFYATFTYTILELVLCTMISSCLFLCRSCQRHELGEEKLVSINGNNRCLNFFHMFAFLAIDVIWLIWTLVYYFTHPFYIFPSMIFSMFSIATICLLFILLPQIYYYSKIKINDLEQYQSKFPSPTLYSNKLASNDQELLLEEKHPLKKSESEVSYELGESGTFLPITRTPKGPFKVTKDGKKPTEKLDDLIYGEQNFNSQKNARANEMKVNTSGTDLRHPQEQHLQPPIAPLQRQSTSSSVASDFLSPVSPRHPPSEIPYYSAYPPARRDETIIPILCTSERPRTSTPVQMRILVNNTPSSSVPTTRRLHSGNDLRPIRQSYARPPVYYSPQPQQYLYIDPYRTAPSQIGGNTWQSVLLQPSRSTPTSSYRRFPYDHRSLSQRLWDIDSGDDDDEEDEEIEEDIIKVVSRHSPPPPPVSTSNVHFHPDEDILLHIDDDAEDEQENSTYRKQYAHV